MRNTGTLLLALIVVFGVGLRGQARTAPRTILLVVDDLHLEFRSTPAIRDLARRVMAALARNDDQWALVSTGTSDVSIAPTSDLAAIGSAIPRVAGNGLTARSFIDARQQAGRAASELRYRAATAFSTVAQAIDAVSAAGSSRPLIVLYVSSGYDADQIAEPTALIRAAVRAKAPIYTIDPRGLPDATAASGVSQADWDTYLEVTRRGLSTLARRTQGAVIFTLADLDAVRSRLATGGP